MAREPVTKEPVTREPVPVEEPPTPTSEVKKRTPPPLDEDGWRDCARPDCASRFKPDQPSRAFCSEECAQIMFYREHGMEKSAAALIAKEKRDESGALIRERRGVVDPDKEAKKDARYGPLREIDRVLNESQGRKRVILKECQHEVTMKTGAKRTRCRTCKNSAANSKSGVDASKSREKRVAVQREGRSVREPVKREPVEIMTPEEFVRRGQAAQKAVDAEIKKATKREPVTRKPATRKAVQRKPTAKKVVRKPVKRTTKKPVKRGKR